MTISTFVSTVEFVTGSTTILELTLSAGGTDGGREGVWSLRIERGAYSS